MNRPLWIVLGGQLGAAVALWGSSRLTWATETRGHPGTDATVVIELTGGSVRPLVPLAVLSLAAVAATVAVSGWLRRVLGVILMAVGAVASVFGFADVPGSIGFSWGRLLAAFSGAILIIAGIVLIRFAGTLPKLGSAYQRTNTESRSDDPDKEMWRALSLGKDPTTEDF
jgi:hypothetical protein